MNLLEAASPQGLLRTQSPLFGDPRRIDKLPCVVRMGLRQALRDSKNHRDTQPLGVLIHLTKIPRDPFDGDALVASGRRPGIPKSLHVLGVLD